MIRRLLLACLLPLLAADPDLRPMRAEGDLPEALMLVPAGAPKGIPLLVALHEYGETPSDAVARFGEAAEKAGYALLAPAARGLAFGGADLDGVAGRVEQVRDELGGGPVHLVGTSDSGRAAVLFAFARDRLFRSVVSVGADAPEMGERAPRLRVLVMKGSEDRPVAGLESVEALGDRVEVADFREVPGIGGLDASSLSYLFWFLDTASGRIEAGRDLGLPWRAAPAGLARAKAVGRRGLVYLVDPGEGFRRRTDEIQALVLFDRDLRRAALAGIPMTAARKDAETLFPGARLAPGPALLVVEPDGSVILAQQRKFSTHALAEALGLKSR